MFPIQMTFTVSTPAELAKLVAATGGGTSPVGSAAVAAAEVKPNGDTRDQEVKKAEPAKKDQKAEAAKSAPPAGTASSTTTAPTDAASGDKPIDFTSQIQKPIVAMAAGGKREQALAILKELGAARASDIKPEDYAKAVELIAKAG